MDKCDDGLRSGCLHLRSWLAREFAHKGLLVVIDAIELRLFYAQSAIVYALRAPMRIDDG